VTQAKSPLCDGRDLDRAPSTSSTLVVRERKMGFEPATLTFGKVVDFVRLGLAGPVKCGSVHPVPTRPLRPQL